MKRLLWGMAALGLFLGVTAKAKADYVFSTIDVPSSTFTVATGINTFGLSVGWYVVDGTTHGYLQQSDGSYVLPLDVPGSTLTTVQGINDSGQIVGRSIAGGIEHGYRLSDGSYTPIDVPDSTLTQAYGINGSGQIVGLYSASGTNHGFLRQSDGSYTAIDVPDSTSTDTYGINDSGQIVGSYVAGGTTHGYLRQSDGSYVLPLDVPGSTLTRAFGINASGQIVGTYISGGRRHAFLLRGGSYTTFDVPGSTDTFALGMSASGQIVGRYDDAGGTLHGFLATPMPAFRITAASTAESGTPFDVTVTALNASGNIDTTYQGTVTFSTTDPDSGVVLAADYTFTTGDGGDNGVHMFPSGVTLVTVGEQTVTSTDTVSGMTGHVTVTVGPGP